MITTYSKEGKPTLGDGSVEWKPVENEPDCQHYMSLTLPPKLRQGYHQCDVKMWNSFPLASTETL